MKARRHVAIAAALLISLPTLIACAANQASQAQIKASKMARAGDTVQMVYAGDKTAGEKFCLDGSATVYRFFPPYASVHQRDEMGEVKITRVLDDRTVEGVVLNGRIWNGDTVMQRFGDCIGKKRS